MQSNITLKPFYWLLLGISLMTLTHMRFGIGSLAWISYIPFLHYLRQTSGWKSRLWLFLALFAGWTFATMKICTDHIPLVLAPLFSLPITVFLFPAHLLWARFRDSAWAILIFPAFMVAGEWLQVNLTPFASWGAAAYTQIDFLPVLQLGALFGTAGISFLIYLVNAVLEKALFSGEGKRMELITTSSLLALVLLFGHFRLAALDDRITDQVKVAAIGTDSQVGTGPMPSDVTRFAVQNGLFERSRKAAVAGAKLVVWNEAATAVMPDEEPAWQTKLAGLAREAEIELVAAYVVLISDTPLRYENKYLYFSPKGELVQTYFKHEPVAGEPAVKGTAPLAVFSSTVGKLGGAICYDFDYPYLGLGYGRLDAELIALPSSDWRGIDPIHTQMAAMRAIENGYSILRSTRFGLSAGITASGRFTAQMSAYDGGDRIMLAQLPIGRIRTLYSLTGDIFVLLVVLLAVCGILIHVRSIPG